MPDRWLVEVEFRLWHLQDKDFVPVLAGNIPELGKWNAAHGTRARFMKTQQYWSSVARVPINTKMEWKWVLVDKNGGKFKWEDGPNKVLEIGIYGGRVDCNWNACGTFSPDECTMFAGTHFKTIDATDALVVVGSTPALGEWNPRMGVVAVEYPFGSGWWVARAIVEKGMRQEWKWAVIDANWNVKQWEDRVNRQFESTDDMVELSAPWNCDTVVEDFGQKRSRLTVDEILTRLDDSDIDLSDSDDGDSADESCMFASNNDDDPNTQSSNDSDSDEGDNDAPCPSTSSGQSGDKKAQQKTKTPALNWYSVNRHQFNPGSTAWLQINGPKDQPESPAGYFFKYFPPSIFLTFAEQTNMYYFRTKGKNLGTKPEEIRKFFGVSIIMANLGFPRIRMYWQHATKVDRVANALPVNRYFQLRTNLHINAAQEAQNGETNKFWKVQPLVDVVRARCRELPREEFSSVDEQMIPFTGRVPAKQFIKSKPNPVGVKNFVICGKSGRALDFELYQGKGTGIPEETKHLELGASIVLRLTETIPKEKNYKVCFDNYFTGIPLIRELKQNGIHSLGVIKSNRLMGCTLKSEKELKKEGRGSLDCKVSGKGDICAVRWFDNGIVTLASSFVGVGEMDQVRRWSESSKVHILVDRPQCVQIYNDYMGGVDKLDFLISLYRIKSRTRKWPVRVVFHFIDLALVNSWLEYRDHERAHGIPRARILHLLAFRNEVAEVFLRANPPAPPVVGRPRLSCSPPKDAPDAKRSRPAERPVEYIRYDGVNHLPDSVKHLGQRCKLEGCKGRSRVKCVKCKVFLCLNSTKNCFMMFHTK